LLIVLRWIFLFDRLARIILTLWKDGSFLWVTIIKARLQDLRFYFSSESQLINLLLNHKIMEPRCTCRLKTEHNLNLNKNTEIDMSFIRDIFV